MIESYSFGKMVINRQEYTQDLMILPDGTVLDHWWREVGHILSIRDLSPIVDSAPALLLVGTGMPGMMKPAASLVQDLHAKGIDLKIMPTQDAVAEFNRLKAEGTPFAACFHLTC